MPRVRYRNACAKIKLNVYRQKLRPTAKLKLTNGASVWSSRSDILWYDFSSSRRSSPGTEICIIRQMSMLMSMFSSRKWQQHFHPTTRTAGDVARMFAARCYASAALTVMRCPSVCVTVCLSVTFVDSVETNKHIFNVSPSGSHTILVFSYKTSWQYSDRDPPP